ncbi:MAG: AI-2E family transporter [Nanoarchaeota archaeon]|nr:AI-2E family transporter [Nanoarchaeota archaeon]
MDENFRKIATVFIVVSLLLLSFLILKPIIVPVMMALILAFILYPVYEWIYRRTRSKDLSAIIVIVLLMVVVILPIWLLTPMLLRQVAEVVKAAYDIDFITPIESLFPSLFVSESLSAELGYAFYSLTTKAVNFLSQSLTNFVLNLPIILLKLTVVLFTLFFVLKEKDSLKEYIGSILPFSKETERKLFAHTTGMTSSILYGHFIVGILQGIIIGIGLLIFGISNALLLTILSIFAGVLPIVGVFIIWAPVAIYLFSSGHALAAWGMIFFGLVSSNIDNLLRPMIVAKRVDINPALVLIAMIGGLFFFGILGLILGPLIISYLLIILELYRGKTN